MPTHTCATCPYRKYTVRAHANTHTHPYMYTQANTHQACVQTSKRNNAVLVRHKSKRLRVTAEGATQSYLVATRADTYVQGLQESLKTGSYVQHLGNAAALRPQQGGRPRRARAMERRRRITSQYISCRLLRTRPCCM